MNYYDFPAGIMFITILIELIFLMGAAVYGNQDHRFIYCAHRTDVGEYNMKQLRISTTVSWSGRPS